MAPLGLWFRFGHWYLVAWDLDSLAVRTFRVDRIEGDVTRGEAGAEGVPEDIDIEAALPDEPWDADGENVVEMRIKVDALEARRVADEVGEDKVTRRLDDGSIELVLGVSSFASIRSWVLGLADHATVLEPPAFRDELVEWLTALTEAETETRSRVRRRRWWPPRPMRAAPARRADRGPPQERRRAGGCDGCSR